MNKKIVFILICAIFLIFQLAYAMGLSTAFGRVKVDNIKVGQAYSMEMDAKRPFIVKNTSDMELALKIDVLLPKEKELVEGYEARPDTLWIETADDDWILSPEGEAVTDIIISIPDEEKYKGKKYQVYIWSHTTGGAIAVGLKSKLLISIAE